MGEILARVVARHHRLFIGAGLVVLAVAVAGATRVSIDAGLGVFFDESHPSYQDFARFEDAFGSDKQVLILLEADDIFTREGLRAVRDYTEALLAERRVVFSEVVSLTAITDVVPTDDGFEIRPVVETLPESVEERQALRERVLGGPLVDVGLVASDGTATAVLARLRQTGVEMDAEAQFALLETMRSVVERHRPDAATGITVHLVGGGELEEALRLGLQRENAVFWPITTAVLFALMVLLIGSLVAALFAVFSVLGALLLVLAAMGVSGIPFDFVSAMLPVVVLTVGVADAIHIISHFQTAASGDSDRERALVATFSRVFRPCLVSMITTVMGFGSLVLSEQAPVRNFGVFAALGIAAAFLVNMTLLPALLTALPPRRLARPHFRLRAVLERLQRAGAEAPLATIGLSALVIAVGALGYGRLETGINSRHFFRDPVPELTALEVAERKLSGVRTIEMLLEGEPGQMIQPELLRWVGDFEAAAQRESLVQGSDSLLSLFGRVSTALGSAPDQVLPESTEAAQRRLFLYELGGGGSDVRRWLDYETNSTTRVSIRHAMADSTELVALVGRLEEIVAAVPPPEGVSAAFTGQGVVASEISEAARRTLVESFALASVAIFLTLAVLVRSPLLAGLAMIPNLLPVVLGVGFLGWFRVPLDAMTATVACVGLGLAVNDTLHFLEGFLAEHRSGQRVASALSRTMSSVGVPIVHTSVILAGGLSVLLLGRFQPTVNMGAVLTTIVLVALICDLVLLPALLRVWAREQTVPSAHRPAVVETRMEARR